MDSVIEAGLLGAKLGEEQGKNILSMFQDQVFIEEYSLL